MVAQIIVRYPFWNNTYFACCTEIVLPLFILYLIWNKSTFRLASIQHHVHMPQQILWSAEVLRVLITNSHLIHPLLCSLTAFSHVTSPNSGNQNWEAYKIFIFIQGKITLKYIFSQFLSSMSYFLSKIEKFHRAWHQGRPWQSCSISWKCLFGWFSAF